MYEALKSFKSEKKERNSWHRREHEKFSETALFHIDSNWLIDTLKYLLIEFKIVLDIASYSSSNPKLSWGKCKKIKLEDIIIGPNLKLVLENVELKDTYFQFSEIISTLYLYGIIVIFIIIHSVSLEYLIRRRLWGSVRNKRWCSNRKIQWINRHMPSVSLMDTNKTGVRNRECLRWGILF